MTQRNLTREVCQPPIPIRLPAPLPGTLSNQDTTGLPNPQPPFFQVLPEQEAGAKASWCLGGTGKIVLSREIGARGSSECLADKGKVLLTCPGSMVGAKYTPDLAGLEPGRWRNLSQVPQVLPPGTVLASHFQQSVWKNQLSKTLHGSVQKMHFSRQRRCTGGSVGPARRRKSFIAFTWDLRRHPLVE